MAGEGVRANVHHLEDRDRSSGGRHRAVSGALVVSCCIVMAGLLAGCSGGSPSASTSTTTSSASSTSTTTAAGPMTVAEVRAMQESLKKVGCYSGAIDGVIGPQTTNAIRDFQAGSHLTVDGVYGPDTEGLLAAAVKAGAKTCTSTPTTVPTTTTSVPATTTTTSAAAVSAPCTAAALGAALGSGKTLISYQCGNGWAAGSWTNSTYAAAFLLRSKGGVWVQPPTDACNEAAALGIPANVLNVSPCKVS